MNSVSDGSQKHTFHALDGLRGVAALAVVILHWQINLRPIALPSAYLAVDLFFMMSGIVVAYSYDRRLASGLSFYSFLLMRIIRLYPLYAFGLAIAATMVTGAIIAGQSNWSFKTFAPAFLFQVVMLPNLTGTGPRTDLYPSNAPAWSLFWELASNMAYAASFRLLSLRVLVVLVAVAAISLILGCVHFGGLDFGSNRDDWIMGPARVGYGFTIGVLLIRLHSHNMLPRLRIPTWCLICIVVLAFATPATFGWFKDIAIVLVAFPLVCVAAVGAGQRNAPLYAFFGAISYSVYVTHIPIPYDKILLIFAKRPLEAWAPWSGFVLIPPMVFIAWALTRYYDAPLRRATTSNAFIASFLRRKSSSNP